MKKFILTLAILIVTALPVFGEDDVISKFENGEEVNFIDLYNAINENSIALYSDSSDVTSPEFYDQLTGAEKDMYDLLNTNIESTLTGTSDLKYTYETTISKNIDPSTSEGNSQYWNEITTAFENQYGMSIANAVVRADFALLYLDKPQYFWININKLGVGMSGGYDKNSGKATAYITIVKPYSGTDKSYDNYYPDCYTDEGARYVGEFAIGVNPFITKAMKNILFDEKIRGSIHFTPGNAYDDADNGNRSAIHWDLVLIQTEEYGGGEIYFDDVLIRKDGIFVLDELKCLNPENLI